MTCGGCGRSNHRDRRYCGGCGAHLPPCPRCGFANDRDDRYCGGCGAATEVAAAAPAPRRVTATRPVAVPARVVAACSFSDAEMQELLGTRPAGGELALPDGTIGQDDLDRLFGGDA